MLRALVLILLICGAASAAGPPWNAIAGYGLAAFLLAWLFLPAYRTLRRISRRRRHRKPAASPITPTAPPPTAAQPTSVTQINHYHYYNGAEPQARPMHIIDPDRLGLPQYRPQHDVHNTIYGCDK